MLVKQVDKGIIFKSMGVKALEDENCIMSRRPVGPFTNMIQL